MTNIKMIHSVLNNNRLIIPTSILSSELTQRVLKGDKALEGDLMDLLDEYIKIKSKFTIGFMDIVSSSTNY